MLFNPEMLMRHAPAYYGPHFDALAEMRAMDPDGSLYRGSEFRHIASLKGVPMWTALKIVDPEFMADKKRFYAWLDKGNNRRYCVYDRRRAKRSDMVTFIDGKEI